MRVEVVYASTPEAFWRKVVDLCDGALLRDALESSDVCVLHPEIDLTAGYGIAVFGRGRALHDVLHDGDRVEILRPLLIDPKDARRGRAVKTARR